MAVKSWINAFPTNVSRKLRPAGRPKPAGPVDRTPPGWTRLRRHRALALIVTAVVILIGPSALVVWWINGERLRIDHDAFIDARTVTISSQITAQVGDVPVTDNQLVQAGTVLVTLDKSDYQAQVDQSAAQIDQAQANIANIEAQIGAQEARIEQADKQVEQADAALTFATEQNERYESLVKSGSVTVEQAQQYRSNFLQAQASYAAAQANAVATDKQLAVLQASGCRRRRSSSRCAHAGTGKNQPVAYRDHRPGRGLRDQPDRGEGRVCRGRSGADEVRAA